MNEKLLNLIDSIQKSVFYIFLLVVPIVFIPLPWDVSEKPMGLVFILFFAIIVALEIFRLINRGVLYYTKSPFDLPLLFFSLLAVISSVFSVSFKTSFWGYEERLGSGSVVLLFIFLFTYIIRSFIKTKEDITNSLTFLVFGITIGSILSMLIYWKLGILMSIPFYQDLITPGLTIYSSTRIAFAVSLIGYLLSQYLISIYFKNKQYISGIFTLLSSVLLLLSTLSYLLSLPIIFSIIFIISIVLILSLNIFKKEEGSKLLTIYGMITLVLISILVLFISVPQLRSTISFIDNYLITQVVIPSDFSWRITTSIFGEGIIRAIIGNGYDTFVIGYLKYRDLISQPELLLVSSFTYANNHVINTLANIGLIGFISWIFLGYTFVKELYSIFKSKKNILNTSMYFLGLLVLVYVFSFFVHFTFILLLLLFLLNMVYIITKMNETNKKGDAFVLSMSFFVHKPENKEKETYNTVLTIVLVFIFTISVLLIFKNGLALINAFVAESTYQRYTKVNTENLQERENLLKESIMQYENAVRLSTQDTYSRRFSTLITDYVGVLVEKYSAERDDLEKERLVEEIGVYSEVAIEYSRRATEYNGVIYNNWFNRSNVYSKLVGYGLTIHTRSAITAIREALILNPLNYELYYSAGQLYLINNDDVSARSALSKVLSINNNHVPSVVLSAEIAMKEKKYEEAFQLFTKALNIVKSIDPESGLGILEYLEKKLVEIEPLVNIRKEVKEEEKTNEPTTEEDNSSQTN